MLVLVARQANREARVRNLECQRNWAVVETDIVRRGLWQLPPTIWKRLSCAANAENWNRPAWPAAATRSPCSKWSARRKKSAATILGPAGQARNSRSATEQVKRLRIWRDSLGSLPGHAISL